jgi:A/G-specific adenine glycosylase
MLQQTQVATVIGRFRTWLELFPTLARLAAAPEETVLEAWSGLGYYARARNLHRGAQLLVERFDGHFPTDRKVLESIPGIGPYTAGAILSLACGLQEPLLDGNVFRVFSRLYCWKEPLSTSRQAKIAWAEAARWCDHPHPGAVNEALMELGALTCTPRQPCCDGCPLRPGCAAAAMPDPARWPAPRLVAPTIDIDRIWLLLRHQGKVLLTKPPAGELLAGMWCLPWIEVPQPSTRESSAECAPTELAPANLAPEKLLASLFGLPPAATTVRAGRSFRHSITRHRIHGIAWECELSVRNPSGLSRDEWGECRWINEGEARRQLVHSLGAKALKSLE